MDAAVRKAYVAKVEERLKAGDCFETAMRWAYRAALCSPDFLYHIEPAGKLDDYALAARLSYFFWNSLPDDELTYLAAAGKLHDPRSAARRGRALLKDPKVQRFVEDFLGQWLKLRQIAANDPDRKLYPEFSPYLQDSMVAETRAYFRELIDTNLDARYLVKSDFAMLNEKLAVHYGIAGVSGSADSPRAAAGRLPARQLPDAGRHPEDHRQRHDDLAGAARRVRHGPPARPASGTAAGQRAGRRARRPRAPRPSANSSPSTATMRPAPRATRRSIRPASPWRAFDVIGGFRTALSLHRRRRPAPRGAIDPVIGISFKLGPPVDPSGRLPDGRTFRDITDLQTLLAADPHPLLHNLARQLTVYAAGRDIAFADRTAIERIRRPHRKTRRRPRTLLHELVDSRLFQAARGGFHAFALEIPPRPGPDSGLLHSSSTLQAEEPPTRFRLIGLFAPDRQQDLRDVLADVPELELVRLDYDTAEVTLRYDAKKLFPGSNPQKPPKLEDVVQRLNNFLIPAATAPSDWRRARRWPRTSLPSWKSTSASSTARRAATVPIARSSSSTAWTGPPSAPRPAASPPGSTPRRPTAPRWRRR